MSFAARGQWQPLSSFAARGQSQPLSWRSLADAFADGRPLLVFAGAFYDHASHVLDAEVFDDRQFADPLSAQFACVRLDVDQSPSLAARLGPGTPRIVIVAHDGKLLADRLRPTRADLSTLLESRSAPPPLVYSGVADWQRACDFRLGGFGRPPKLPQAPALSLLLGSGDPPCDLAWARPFVERTLNAIVNGGLHDHLGGGFHRGSADDAWVVPQFGKRAVDQAALIPLLMRAAEILARPHFADGARAAARWVMERLAAPGGGFFHAEDPDAGVWDDASYHTWSLDEARAVLDDDEWQVAQPWFDLYGRGELHSDPTRNVLFVATSVDRLARELRLDSAVVVERVTRATQKLARAQLQRPRPEIDRAVYLSSSAPLAKALLSFPDARAHALDTLDRLAHEPDRGWLEDHAALGVAALAAGRIDLAESCLAKMEPLSDGALYFDSPPCALPGLFGERRLPIADAAGEGGLALAVELLIGLGRHDRAHAIVAQLAPRALALGPAGAGLARHHR